MEQFPSFECLLVYECYVALFEDIFIEDVLYLDTGVNECVACNMGTAHKLVPHEVYTISAALLQILTNCHCSIPHAEGLNLKPTGVCEVLRQKISKTPPMNIMRSVWV